MDKEIVVAAIAAVGSVVTALISSSREANRARASGASRTPRPFLTFAATLALLLSVTALGLAIYSRYDGRKPKDVFDVTPEMSWTQDQKTPTSLGVKEGVCFLTGIVGHFAGGGESVKVALVNGEYVLTETSGKWAVQASARCVKYAAAN